MQNHSCSLPAHAHLGLSGLKTRYTVKWQLRKNGKL